MYASLSPSPPPPGESIKILHLRSRAFGAQWHYHDGFELNAILKGAGTRWVAGSSQSFSPGDIVLVPPGVSHSWVSDQPTGTEMSAAIVVLFPSDIVTAAAPFPELRSAIALLEEAGSGVALEDADGQICTMLRKLTRSSGASRLLGFLECLDMVSRAPRRILGGAAAQSNTGERDRLLVRRALQFIGAAGRDLPSQSEVASALALSPSSFSRKFQRGTGLTYSAFVQARRIERACNLLQRGDLSIAQISYAAGFDNLSNFNRRFRSALGEAPGSYRRRFQKEMMS